MDLNNTKQNSIDVPAFTHWLSGITTRYAKAILNLSKVETSFFEESIEELEINKPVYICGLARAGTTILLELLSTHPEVATHQYRDFPMLYIPIWWNWFLDRVLKEPKQAIERAHKDGIMVTPNSPEALEEVFWMHFFPHAHDININSILDAKAHRPDFESFYRDHIKKILFVRHGYRYLAKGNYNLVRIEYLQEIFPDARFVILVRDPKTHIASLRKQHAFLSQEETRDERILTYMQRVGHFEFGLDCRPMNLNNNMLTQEVIQLWQNGEDIRAWAKYWSEIYKWVLDLISNHEMLNKACLLVRYEDLCNYPSDTLIRVFNHCCLDINQTHLNQLVSRLKFPDYYKVRFSEDELNIIGEETKEVCQALKYSID